MKTRKPRNYWTLEICKKEALKYEYKSDFRKKSNNAYNASRRHDWINNVCSHMKSSGDKYHRCIYAYEFSDKHAYIGLTYNMDVRVHSRNKNPNDSVIKYINKTGLTPKLITLTDYVLVDDAIKLEEYYCEKYKNDGWLMLNQVKTGSVGTINRWNREECIEEAKKCENRTEFYLRCGTYQAAKRYGWLDEVLSYIPQKRKKNGYWTIDKCIEVASKYVKKIEFRKNGGSAYVIACRNNWLDEIYLTLGL